MLKFDSVFDIENSFESFAKLFSTEILVNYFDYNRLFDYYYSLLSSMKYEFYPEPRKEYRDNPFDFPNKENFYMITWCVNTLDDIIKEYNIKPQEFNVRKLSSLVDMESFKPIKKIKKEPIMILQIPYLGSIIGDGDHRIIDAQSRGCASIKGYMLSSQYHYPAITSTYMKTIYEIHYNIRILLKYMLGELSYIDFMKFFREV